MDEYEEKLKQYMREHDVKGEHLVFQKSCHTVEEAAKAVNGSPEYFVKNVLLISREGEMICGIVSGNDRLDIKRLETLVNSKLRMAKPEEALDKTGYQIGGTPSFGYTAKFYLDGNILRKDYVYTGGGSGHSLVKISPKEILRLTNAEVVEIRK